MGNYNIFLSDICLGSEEVRAVSSVMRSRWLTQGPVTEEFERRFAEYIGNRYAIAVANGTAALHLALLALDIGPGDEVICPSLSFVATANAILYVGARPVFADINSVNNFNISADSVKEHISEKTKAIVVVHYAGYPCDMDAIRKLADRRHLKIIEDAAHAHGAVYERTKCGALGDVACFSFFSNKNMTTGEGGMVLTGDYEIAEKVRLLRSHGMTSQTWQRYRGYAPGYDVVAIGYNYRLNELASGIGIAQLKRLEKNNQRRRVLTMQYRKLLSDIEELTLPFGMFDKYSLSSNHIFPTLLNPRINRGLFMDEMKRQGVQCSVHYTPIHTFSIYRKRCKEQPDDLEITEEVGRREVTLPLYPQLNKAMLKDIVKRIKKALIRIKR